MFYLILSLLNMDALLQTDWDRAIPVSLPEYGKEHLRLGRKFLAHWHWSVVYWRVLTEIYNSKARRALFAKFKAFRIDGQPFIFDSQEWKAMTIGMLAIEFEIGTLGEEVNPWFSLGRVPPNSYEVLAEEDIPVFTVKQNFKLSRNRERPDEWNRRFSLRFAEQPQKCRVAEVDIGD